MARVCTYVMLLPIFKYMPIWSALVSLISSDKALFFLFFFSDLMPRFLDVVNWECLDDVSQVYYMMMEWKPVSVATALQLLSPHIGKLCYNLRSSDRVR